MEGGGGGDREPHRGKIGSFMSQEREGRGGGRRRGEIGREDRKLHITREERESLG